MTLLTPSSSELVQQMIRGLKHAHPVHRARAARGLGKLGAAHRESLPALLAATHDVQQSVREAAVQAIAAHGAADDLIQLLRHTCKYVRRNAVWGLAKLGPEALRAVRPLAESLKDRDPRTAAGAAQALGAIGRDAADAVPALAEAMRGANVVLCRMASKALSQIGLPALTTLIQHLKHHDPFVRGEAAVALGWMGPHAGAAGVAALQEQLIPLTPSSAPPVQENSPIVDRDATPLAAAACKESNAEESALIQTIQALGKVGLGAIPALPMLRQLAKHPHQPYRDAAKEAVQLVKAAAIQEHARRSL